MLAQSYLAGMENPFDGILQSYNLGLQARRYRDENAALRLEQERKRQAYQMLKTIDFNNKDDLARFHGMFPEHSKGVKDVWDNLTAQEQRENLALSGKLLAALQTDPSAAVRMADEHAKAYDNAGQPQKAREMRQLAAMAKNNPEMARMSMALMYSIISPKEAIDNYKNYTETTSPKFKEVDSGSAVYGYSVDPLTGRPTQAKKIVDKTATPDNILDNQTSRENNIRTTNATKYGVDKQTEREREKIAWQRQQEEIKQKKGQLKEAGGKVWVVYEDGSYEPAFDSNGEQMLATSNNTNLGKISEIQASNDQAEQLIKSLEDAIKLSEQGIYDGYGASERADLWSNFFGGSGESRRTQEYINIVQNSALSQLKTLVGANPTEGERKLILDLQASEKYPHDVRKKILERSIDAIKARIESNKRQMQMLGGGNTQYQSNNPHGQSGSSQGNIDADFDEMFKQFGIVR